MRPIISDPEMALPIPWKGESTLTPCPEEADDRGDDEDQSDPGCDLQEAIHPGDRLKGGQEGVPGLHEVHVLSGGNHGGSYRRSHSGSPFCERVLLVLSCTSQKYAKKPSPLWGGQE